MREVMIDVLTIALVPVLAYFVTLGAKLLRAKIEEMKEKAIKEGNAKLAAAFELAQNAVSVVAETTVGKIEQVKARDIREMVKDGSVDRQELCKLADGAYQEIINTLKPDIMETLQMVLSDPSSYIRNEIENKVLEVKNKSQA